MHCLVLFWPSAGSTSNEEPPKVQSKLSDANLSSASMLSDAGPQEEAIKEAEERASQMSSRKSSVKDEVRILYK